MSSARTTNRPRGRAAACALLVALAIVSSTLPAAAQQDDPANGSDDRAARSTAERSTERAPETLLLLRSVTGVRADAPTVLGGAVLNQQDSPVDATVVIEDLPAGARISTVRPDPTEPEQGLGWACTGSTCQLVDSTGAPTTLAASSDVPIVLALSGDLSSAQRTLRVRAGDAAAVEVPLELDGGAAPLARDAISVAPSGTAPLAPGASADSTVTVSNLASGPLAAGSINLTRSGGPAGASATLAGEGWTCAGPTCTYSGALEPFERTTPLTVTSTAEAGAADGEAQVTYRAAASLGATPLDATASVPLVIAEPAAQGVSVSVQLRNNSVSPPAEVIADVRVSATGSGALRSPVRVRVETPDGVSIDWDAARVPQPWTCSAAESSCGTDGPLVTGTPSLLPLPVRVDTDAEQGTARLEATAALLGSDGEPAGEPDRAGAGLVVNPPPVAELRATMRAADGTTPVRGESIVFPADEPRDLVVTVTNQGSRAAAVGTEVEVQLRAEPSQRLRSAGDERWRCDRRRSVGDDEPLRCRTTLAQELPSGEAVEMPLQLAAASGGSSQWAVRSGVAGRVPERSDRRVRIDVGAQTPSLTPQVRVVDELERGATGIVRVTMDNRGDGVARGGLLVLDLPAGLRMDSSTGEGWSCVDASLLQARGSMACTYEVDVEPGERSGALELELATDRRDGTLELWAWATAPGQVPQARSGRLTELDVNDGRSVDAGPDLTVVTPVLGADGVERPAVVQLDGRVPAGTERVRWVQRCTTAAERGCGSVQPAVAWLGVEPGQDPDRPTARFVAPAELSDPITLQFELEAERAGRVRSDRVSVRLVPTRVAGAALERDGAGRSAGGDAGGAPSDEGSGGSSGGGGTAAPTTTPDDVTVEIGDGSVLQVATRTDAVLSATATGAAPFSYAWRQTGGASATIAGGTDGPQVQFEAPDLAPQDSSEQLEFEVTVTDALGNTAEASATVQVVWGDDGLQVQLAGGAESVVATVDTPLTVTSTVTSAGAPYTYDWSLEGEIDLPDGTAVDGPDLVFTAPGEPGTGTAQLKVTDSFGRVTVESVPFSVTELPAGEVPAALCSALGELEGGTTAQLGGNGVSVVIPAAGADVNGGPAPAPSTTTTVAPSTTSTPSSTGAPSSSTTTTAAPTTTTTTVPDCAATAGATFTGATATLPGGLSVSDASGELTIAGVTLTGGTVALPDNWGQVDLELPDDGLMVPFVSSTDLGVPTGALDGDGTPLVAPAGWDLSTSVAFDDEPQPSARISSVGSPSSGTGSWSLRGTAVGDGATTLTLSATGLVALGPIDVPVAGGLRTDGPTSPVTSTVAGRVTDRPIAADLLIGSLEVDWSPSAVSGSFSLDVGPVGSALGLTGTATFPVPTGPTGPVSLDVPTGSSVWAPAGANGPQLVLSGSGTVQGDTLDLSVAAAPASPWQPTRATAISGLAATLRADCELAPTQACAPTVSLSGTLDARPVAASPVPLSGSLNVSTGITTLTAEPGNLRVVPVQVGDTAWTAVLSPTGTTVQATGMASVLGSDRRSTVRFTDDVVVAEAELGERTLVPGWTVQGAVALAADVSTDYSFSAGPRSGSVAVVAGQLLGAGATELPAALGEGVLPLSMQGGVVTFPITDSAAGPYRLSLVDEQGWNVTPEAGSLAELAISSLDMDITADGQQAQVALTGAASLQVTGIDGEGTPALPLLLTGTLTSDQGSGTLAANLTNAAWSSPFGFAGVDATTLSIALSVTPTATRATLGGTASLQAALVSALGASVAAVPISGALNVATPALVVGAQAAWAVDPGSSGLLATEDAALVVAPAADTTLRSPTGSSTAPASSVTVGRGVTLVAALPNGETLQLPVDPSTLDVGGTAELGSVLIGGAPLTGVTVDVATQQLQGSLTLDSSSLPVSGTISPAVAGAPYGQVALQLTEAGATIELGGRSVQVSSLGLTTSTTIGPGSPAMTLDTTVTAFGSSIDATLAGYMSGGSVSPLSGTVPSNTYTLASGDTLTGALQLSFGPPPTTDSATSTPPTPTPSAGWVLTIGVVAATASSTTEGSAASAASATPDTPAPTLVAGGYTHTLTSATVSPDGQSFGFKGALDLPGSPAGGVAMSGSYTTDGSSGTAAGTFSSSSKSDATLTLAGFDVVGTPTIQRSKGQLTATFTGTASFGLFDGDSSVALTGSFSPPATPEGAISVSLSGELGATSFRGLQGTAATFRIRPGDNPLEKEIGAYLTDITFQAAPDSCSFWDSDPLFTGATYRYEGTTYYTLDADVDLNWPSGLAVSVPWGQVPQPLVLSNETAPGTQPAPGLTLQAGFAGTTFTALGMFAFDPVACSFSVGGTLIFQFTSGPQGRALAQNLQQGPIVQVSQTQFGNGNSVPESIQTVRNEFIAHQMLTELTEDVSALRLQTSLARSELQLSIATLADLATAAATARQTLADANAELARANAELTAASSALEQQRAQAAVNDAQQGVASASERVASAQAAVQGATTAQASAEVRASVANDMESYANDRLDDMMAVAEAAEEAAESLQGIEQREQQAQTQAHASPVMITVDWTHCDTCEEQDVFNLDGEVIFANKVIVGADLELSWGEEFQIDGSFTLGYQWLVTVGSSHLYAQGQAVVEGTIDLGFVGGDGPGSGWDEFAFDVQAQATVSVDLSLWFATYSATLAQLTAEFGVQVIPSPATYSGSITLDIFGLDPTFGFGPEDF